MRDEGGQHEKEQDRHPQREGDQRPLHRPFKDLFRASVSIRLALFLQSDIGREHQALDPQPERVPQQCQAADEGCSGESPPVYARIERFSVNDNVALRVAHGNRQRARAAHHDAFDDGLAAIVHGRQRGAAGSDRRIAIGSGLAVRH